MSTNRIRITSTEYELPNFAFYEFFADPTNLALDAVEAGADVQAIAFSNQWLHTGIAAGSTWYYWARTVRYNGLELARSSLLAIGAVVAGSIGTADISDGAVTYAKIQNVSATDKVLGRSSAGAGVVQEIACTAAGRALLAGASAAAQRTTLGAGSASGLATLDGSAYLTSSQFPALTGDVTSAGGGLATTIGSNVVSFAKFQQISTARLLGRSTAGTGNVEQISLGSGLTLTSGVLDVAPTAGAVSSVFGRTGAVVAATNDYAFSQISGSVTLAQLPSIADGKILSNISGSSAVPAANGLSAIIDAIIGNTRGSVLYRGASAWSALAPGSSGNVLTSGGVGADPSWTAVGGTGTVTSVGLTAPGFLSVSGSPVTGSGTLALSLATQSANQVFAGPTTGSAAAPTFRALVGADLPNPSSSTLGGVQSKAAVSHQFLTSISTSGVPALAQPAHADLSDYEAGTWTPTEYYGAFTWTSTRGRYRRHGDTVIFNGYFAQAASQPSATQCRMGGLPFNSANIDVHNHPAGSTLGFVNWYQANSTAYLDLYNSAFAAISLSTSQGSAHYVGGHYLKA